MLTKRDFTTHAKSLGLKVEEQMACKMGSRTPVVKYVIAFAMRDATQFQLMFKYDLRLETVEMEYFVVSKAYHVKMQLAEFMQLTPEKLNAIRISNQYAIDLTTKMMEELKQIPKLQKASLQNIIGSEIPFIS